MPTKEEAEKSFVLMMKDSNNEKITRIAFPEDVQIGTSAIPSELMLTGRLSFNTKEYEINDSNSGIVNVNSNDTIIGISGSIALASARVNLPNNPRVGQLHHIKDIFGTSGVSPINVYGSGGSTIDSASFKAINTAYSSLSVYWNGSEWKTFGGGGGGGVGPTGATGATGPTGPTGLLWEQSLHVDTGNAYAGTSGFASGNFTVGTLYYISRNTTVNGIQFYWPGTAAKTVKASLYQWGVASPAATVSVSAPASAGVIQANFASPYTVTGNGVGGRWSATVYVTDASGYPYYQQTEGHSKWAFGYGPIIVGRNIFMAQWSYASGDASPDNFWNGSNVYAVDLILG